MFVRPYTSAFLLHACSTRDVVERVACNLVHTAMSPSSAFSHGGDIEFFFEATACASLGKVLYLLGMDERAFGVFQRAVRDYEGYPKPSPASLNQTTHPTRSQSHLYIFLHRPRPPPFPASLRDDLDDRPS